MKRAAVFLDRDGVLNEPVWRGGQFRAPLRFEEFRLLPGVEEAASRLRDEGFALVVVTNQPEVARGELPLAELARMHDWLRERLKLDAIEVCPHGDADACGCRKPRPGMVVGAATRLGLDLGRSFLVGDRWRDVDAGRAAGCRTILVGGLEQERECQPDLRAADLPEAARLILLYASRPEVP